MNSFSLSEYDPSFHDLSRLHVIVSLPEEIDADFQEMIKERFPSAGRCYDQEVGLLILIADRRCEAGVFLPQLAEAIREFGHEEVEILETRMAVPEDESSVIHSGFSRFVVINSDRDGSGKKFSLQLTGATVFGSGNHPSTKLAALALEHLFSSKDFPARVLDIGCGSGILSFCCGFFGAEEVLGIDISSEAIEIARKNRELNSQDCKIDFSREEITGVSGKFDLLIANVSAAVMSGMVDDFGRLVTNHGKLVLSGLQGRQLKEMSDKMQDRGFMVSASYGQDQWRAVLLAAQDIRP